MNAPITDAELFRRETRSAYWLLLEAERVLDAHGIHPVLAGDIRAWLKRNKAVGESPPVAFHG